MSRIKDRDTSIELSVRKYLHGLGFRYRISSDLPGRPDMVFPGKKIAVFINGCFWHMHGCSLTVIPSTRTEFWKSKLMANRERDSRKKEELLSSGWRVITIWECEIERSLKDACIPLINSLLEDS